MWISYWREPDWCEHREVSAASIEVRSVRAASGSPELQWCNRGQLAYGRRR